MLHIQSQQDACLDMPAALVGGASEAKGQAWDMYDIVL